jgi:phosphopantothenoylcysteine decarboxylase/phosphopantothenate--cysteine ligase
LVGFAAETGSPIEEGFRKCREKGLEFIVANDVTKPGCGFATDTNQAYIIKKDGLIFKTPLVTKERLAKIILDNAL